MAMQILVSGATGFVGQAVCAQAVRQGFSVRSALRKHGEVPGRVETVVIGEINGATDWGCALRDVDVVIHLAARVHVMKDAAADPLAEFLEVNLHGTVNLAEQAVRAGVRRFVYVSSIKVNGESTAPMHNLNPSTSHSDRAGRRGFSESDKPNPQDAYGMSKWQAEQALQCIARETGLEVVIVRPPLVYGPGVKGNFAQMIKVLTKGIPLPLASVQNLRSLVYVENLVDALIVCATHPSAAGQTYLVSDGEDVSTPDLLRQLGAAMGHPARLFSCPPFLLKLAGGLTGKSSQFERLLGSLQVNSTKICRELNWRPPYTLQQGLQTTAEWYRTRCR